MLSPQTIREFQHLAKEEGRKLTEAEALEILRTLVKSYDLLAKIYHRMMTENNDDNKKL